MLSRVAENLYWMSRYLERAEHAARLLAVKLETAVEQTRAEAEASWRHLPMALSSEKYVASAAGDAAIVQALSHDHFNPTSLISSVRNARDNARQVREQISTEMWEHLNRLYLRLAPIDMAMVWRHQPARHFRDVMDALILFEGITFSTMRHGEGWHFIALGRYMERAQLICRLMGAHFGNLRPDALKPSQSLYSDWVALLRFCAAFEAYTKVYTASIQPERIAEFLLFDAEFPHSIRFAIDRLAEALAAVAPGAPTARRALCQRLAGRLRAHVDYGQIDEIDSESFNAFLTGILDQCADIHEAVYAAYIAYGAETVL